MKLKRILFDLYMITYILIMPMWLMELLHIDRYVYNMLQNGTRIGE